MRDFLDVFWRAFLVIAGLLIFVFVVPYLGYCFFGDVGGIIGVGVMICTLFAVLIAGIVVTFK